MTCRTLPPACSHLPSQSQSLPVPTKPRLCFTACELWITYAGLTAGADPREPAFSDMSRECACGLARPSKHITILCRSPACDDQKYLRRTTNARISGHPTCETWSPRCEFSIWPIYIRQNLAGPRPERINFNRACLMPQTLSTNCFELFLGNAQGGRVHWCGGHACLQCSPTDVCATVDIFLQPPFKYALPNSDPVIAVRESAWNALSWTSSFISLVDHSPKTMTPLARWVVWVGWVGWMWWGGWGELKGDGGPVGRWVGWSGWVGGGRSCGWVGG